MPPASRRPGPAFARWQQLAFFCVAMMVATGWLTRADVLQSPNRFLQDTFVSLLGRDVDDGQIVIVAIDDKSIAALGRWPWRRAYHAELIDRLSEGSPRSIGMDLLLTEPDARAPADDATLAAAMARSGRVVLPLMMQVQNGQASAVLPLPALARRARALGHAHLGVDSDGIARTVYLEEGIGDRRWPYFSVAMLEQAARPTGEPTGARTEGAAPSARSAASWERSRQIIVPFARPAGRFRRISYVDVLDGSVSPAIFKDKYVLVGATAAGIGDSYATPMSRTQGLMSGVEYSANVLDAVLNDRKMVPAPHGLDLLVNLSCVAIAVAAYSVAGPFAALLLSAALILLMPALAGLALLFFGVQLSPVGAMLGVALSYAIWSWRQLSEAAGYLMRESERLHRQGGIADLVADPLPPGDFMGRRIHVLSAAADQLSNLHRFVRDTLEGLPDATLVCDRGGRVLLANAAAGRYFAVDREQALHGMSVTHLMKEIRSAGWNAAVLTETALAEAPAHTTTLSADGNERDLLIKKSPTLNAQGDHTGWILSLLDVTEVRQTQRQRDEAMRFLSHDMREPLSAILTLQALQRQNPDAMPQAQFQERIERHASKALALSDSFTQLVRAQSSVYQRETHDLTDLLMECVDDAWEATHLHGIGIFIMAGSAEQAHSLIDRPLVQRAVSNLLGNALKFSARGSRIHCGIETLPDAWAILVQDEGPGIAPELAASLFEPFVRGGTRRDMPGAGLGLAFVKTVAQRHGGQVTLRSVEGLGSAFRLVLPRA